MRYALVVGTLAVVLTGIILTTGCSGGGTSSAPPPKTLTSIAVAPANPSIATGITQQFTATGKYSDGSSQDLTASVQWSSSQSTVAAISNGSGTQGLATSVATGASLITAALGSVSGSTTLTVTAVTLTSVSVTPASPSILVGNTEQFTATAHYSDSSTQDVTTTANWSSSDPTVATISNAAGAQGLATGVKSGTVTVTAALSPKNGTASLSVTNPVNTSAWTQDGPVARFAHSAAFDSTTRQMIVFGGEDTATGTDLNDLWLIGTGVDRHLKATAMSATGGPSPRHGHTATYDETSNRMTIFAGGTGSAPSCKNDLWVLQGANGQNSPATWVPLNASGTLPSARINHDGVYDSTANSMIVFGGSNCAGGFLNDVWVLSDANGQSASSTLTKLAPSGTPPAAREASSAIYDADTNVLIVYGGDAGSSKIFGDVWTLSNANGTDTAPPAWTQLATTGSGPAARSGHSAIYDSANNRMIVFGGVSGSTTFGETWILTHANALDGSPVWSDISATGTAPTLYFHTAAYDAIANAMYLFGGTSTTSKLQISNHTFVLSKANGLPSGSQNWTVSGPPVRYSQSAFYDSGTNSMFVFGGQHATSDINFNDYWRNTGVVGTTGVDWTNVAPSGTKPAARFGHTALYDSVSNRMMLFGGGTGSPAPCFSDYFVLQHANAASGIPAWVLATPAGTTPAARMNYAAAYDAASNSLIMFGGYDCVSSYFNDVWVLSHANNSGTPAWTKLSPAGTPPAARESSSAVYDPGTNSLIVFGGDAFVHGSAPFGDVWLLSHANGSGGTPAWTQLTPLNILLAARSGHSALYDTSNNRMIIYGGFDGTTVLSDTWILSDANGQTGTPLWTQLDSSPPGPPRRWQSAVYDPASNEMLIFGGVSVMSPLAPDANTFSLTDANGLP
jgi:hypothetical protein